MILEDYSGGAVLERLLRCERRIEGSLFRNLSELRRVHDQQPQGGRGGCRYPGPLAGRR